MQPVHTISTLLTRPPAAAASARRTAPQPGAALRQSASGRWQTATADALEGPASGRHILRKLAAGGARGGAVRVVEGTGRRACDCLPACLPASQPHASRAGMMLQERPQWQAGGKGVTCADQNHVRPEAPGSWCHHRFKHALRRGVPAVPRQRHVDSGARPHTCAGGGNRRGWRDRQQGPRRRLGNTSAAVPSCHPPAPPLSLSNPTLPSPPSPVSCRPPLPGHTPAWCRSMSSTEGSQ
jgi:hypothetical protein